MEKIDKFFCNGVWDLLTDGGTQRKYTEWQSQYCSGHILKSYLLLLLMKQ